MIRKGFILKSGRTLWFWTAYSCLMLLSCPDTFCLETNAPLRIVVDSSILPKRVLPGDIPPGVFSPNVMEKLFPELRNPRVMRFSDLTDPIDQKYFLNEGYSFVLGGDFNNDGLPDIALVGRYDNSEHPEANVFVAILSIEKKEVVRASFDIYGYYPGFAVRKYAAIKLIPKPKFLDGVDGIQVALTFGSDDCAVMYWNKIEYSGRPCSDIAEYMYEDDFDRFQWIHEHIEGNKGGAN